MYTRRDNTSCPRPARHNTPSGCSCRLHAGFGRTDTDSDRSRSCPGSVVLPRSRQALHVTPEYDNNIITRQLSYRKEDRAMRPIHECPEKFPESSLRTRLLFLKFLLGFCSDRY